MIDDAAWITYPLHFLAGMLQLALASLALVGIIILGTLVWLFNSHDNRAELTKNFATEQEIYRVDLGQALLPSSRVRRSPRILSPRRSTLAMVGS